VFQPGNTVFTPLATASAGFPPSGYTLLADGPNFNVSTSSPYAAPVVVCIVASQINDPETFARLRILHREGNSLVDRTILSPAAPAPDFATRTVCASVEQATDFYLALGPLYTVTGRVTTPSGQGLRNAVVVFSDSRGVQYRATTSSFGTYLFPDARVGETYSVTVRSRRYRFAPRNITITGDATEVNFVGLE
jgi:hypothetical protein